MSFVAALSVFIAAFIIAIPILLVLEDVFKRNLKADAYARWHDLVKDYKSFFSTAVIFALLIVGGYWLWHNAAKQANQEARDCIHNPSDCPQPEN